MQGDGGEEAYLMQLKMLAVQIVAQLPASKEDAEFVLRRADMILRLAVHDDPSEEPRQ